MEANLFIKSYRAEGNKVKDIQFYGDWEIDIGGGSGETVRKALRGIPDYLSIDFNRDDVRVKNSGDSNVYATYAFRSNYKTLGAFSTYNDWAEIAIRPGQTMKLTLPNDTKGYGERFAYLLFKVGGKIIGYVKATIKNGEHYIEGV